MQNLFQDKKNCCGCTACKSICPTKAIVMKADEEGFLYPLIDKTKCTNCGLCKKVCAFQNGYEKPDEEVPLVYALKHKDNDVLMTSTSGGAFTAISDYILDLNGVVYGVAFDQDMNVSHEQAVTKKERDRFKGSKYSQSDLKETFVKIKTDLKENRYVLFTGTPCQTAGLRSFLTHVDTSKLVLCDLVCHGTLSPLIWKEYVHFCEKKNKSKIVEYYHRSKATGWGSHTEMAVYENGKRDYKSNLVQIYKKFFQSVLPYRMSCYSCPYANLQRPSDITIADFWGLKKHMPEFYDSRGVSLVLVNTKKGQDLFEKIKHSVHYHTSNQKDCLQPNLERPTPMPQNRERFWIGYKTKGFKYVLKKYGGYHIIKRVGRKVKRLLNSKGR